MADTKNLLGYSQVELEELAVGRGEEKFRGRQIFRWLYSERATRISEMTNLSLALRDSLARDYAIRPPEILERAKSADGTEKFLLACEDGVRVETVLIPDKNTTTACVSSQAGCPLACRFCATGTLDLQRNLSAGEIVGQALILRNELGESAFTNVVFMGMGEPLLNFEELVKALGILTAPDGLGLSPRRITVSTSGITPKIKKLSATGLRVNLALSLHAADQRKREKIMPVAKTFALEPLIDSVKRYSRENKRRITFEYILLKDFNDTPEDVRALAQLAQGFDCKVNLIAYNPVEGLPFGRPSPQEVDRFATRLADRGTLVTVRTSRGRDIDAACGQLALKSIKRNTSGRRMSSPIPERKSRDGAQRLS